MKLLFFVRCAPLFRPAGLVDLTLGESTVGSHTNVGPFAYVRPNSTIGDHVKVGDFVEIKNSVIGNGTKISHLTYVGDSDVGQDVNFGTLPVIVEPAPVVAFSPISTFCAIIAL